MNAQKKLTAAFDARQQRMDAVVKAFAPQRLLEPAIAQYNATMRKLNGREQ